MVRFGRLLSVALLALSLPAAGAFAQDQAPAASPIVVAQAKKRAAPAVRNTGTHVYLLRGFMDVFSTGMDDLTVKLNRSGIRASVHGHAEYYSLADQIGARHQQGIRENVVIIGHSLGANAAFQMADRLGEFGITVPLIITYDPTASMTAGSNVSRVVNFYSSTNGWGVPIGRGTGFRGNLANVDLSRRGDMGHTDIDKSPALHSQSIGFIRSIGGGGRTTSATAPTSDAGNAKENQSSTATPAPTNTSAAPATPAAIPAVAQPRVIDTMPAAAKSNVPVNDAAPASTASVAPAASPAPAPATSPNN